MKKYFPLWVFPVLLLMAIGTVFLRLEIVRTSYAINQSEKKIRALKLDREQLELKMAQLRSPKRLEILARTKFGLTHPSSTQVIYLK